MPKVAWAARRAGLSIAARTRCVAWSAAGSVRTEVFERVTHLFTYLTMPFMGCFYMAFWLPTDLQRLALLNPTLHFFEMMRYGLYGLRVPTHFDLGYILVWTALVNLLGMAAIRAARRHLVI